MRDRLNLTALQNAVQRLDEGWERYRLDISDAQIRDGLIQRFEFTYEISHKMLKRYLELASANPAQYDEMAFADLVRSGCEQGLLRGDWTDWKLYREMRSKTSHTYDEAVAQEVVERIPAFLGEARFLLAKLQERTAA
ncbi:MAG: nucleotidyltransferase substrate binding protein [Pseudomonadota bacterium]